MKNTKGLATEYQMRQWSEVMRSRAESGLSIRSYCQQAGIHPNRYHYWQRKLREAAIAELQIRESENMLSAQGSVQLSPSGWTQVAVSAETSKGESTVLTVEIGKCRIVVNESMDTELLGKVCKVLVSIC